MWEGPLTGGTHLPPVHSGGRESGKNTPPLPLPFSLTASVCLWSKMQEQARGKGAH